MSNFWFGFIVGGFAVYAVTALVIYAVAELMPDERDDK